jgi:hypothetical protein
VSLFRRARSQGIADGRAQVLALLRDEAFTVTVTEDGEEVEYEIASVSELEGLQVGYSVTPEGDTLIDENGGWRERWLVIGFEELTGDPAFVDLADPALPVLTAMHGEGEWEPLPLAKSLRGFLDG